MLDLTFVCWKWKSPFPNDREFPPDAVNVLRALVAKYYGRPHRFVCITDDTTGLDPGVEACPMPETGLEELKTLRPPANRFDHRGRLVRKIQFPSCYRRLWMFSEEARQLGEWVFCLDLDCLIVGDLEPLVDDFPSDFVGWLREPNRWRIRPALAGAVYKLRTGSHTEVWEEFDPETSPRQAMDAGYSGTDQAWMSYKLLPTNDRMWVDTDGLGKPDKAGPRPYDRILFTAGYAPPWSEEYQGKRPWVCKRWAQVESDTRQGAPSETATAL